MSQPPKLLTFAGLLFAGFPLIGLLPAQAKQGQVKPKDQLHSGTPLSAIDKKHLLEDNFALVKTVSAIPLLVQKKILGSGVRDGMADAGQPYEPSDMVGPKPLPFRRLIFAGTSLGYCVVYNEYGGYGTGQEVSLYRLMSGRAALAWRANVRDQSRYLTLVQLRDAVRKSKLLKDAK